MGLQHSDLIPGSIILLCISFEKKTEEVWDFFSSHNLDLNAEMEISTKKKKRDREREDVNFSSGLKQTQQFRPFLIQRPSVCAGHPCKSSGPNELNICV